LIDAPRQSTSGARVNQNLPKAATSVNHRSTRPPLLILIDARFASRLSRYTLTMLCEREIARKDHRRIEMALKLAHFPAVKELTGFDFEAQPSIDPKQIRDLAASRWIANGENVLLLGPCEPAS
jgi:DNA replication protein DnaC